MAEIHIIKMADITCHLCTIAFSVPKAFDDARQNDGIAFNCPNGHSIAYQKSKIDICNEAIEELEKENLDLKRSREGWMNTVDILEKSNKSFRNQLVAYRGHITRLRNKLSAIVRYYKT